MVHPFQSSLSKSEQAFIEMHGLKYEWLFDAQGKGLPFYKVKMELLEKRVAFNTTPCKDYGHKLRSRHGHCLQCDEKRIAWVTRKRGFTYLAFSNSQKLVKVGFSEKIENREDSLNRTKYGGIADWKVFCHVKTNQAFKLESTVQKALRTTQVIREYEHGGFRQYANELFKSSPSDSLESLTKSMSELSISINKLVLDHNFSNLI